MVFFILFLAFTALLKLIVIISFLKIMSRGIISVKSGLKINKKQPNALTKKRLF